MKLSEVKANLKKDPPSSLVIFVHRKIGLYMSWILINAFPQIHANTVTKAMGWLTAIAAFLSAYGVIKSSIVYLILGFLVYFISLSLDCADGNIARIKNETSINGVVIDRIVHNITHPLVFICLGFSLLHVTGRIFYAVVFSVASVLVEFPPFEYAIKDVKLSFINQIVYKKTKNFSLQNYSTIEREETNTEDRNEISTKKRFFNYGIEFVKAAFEIDTLFVLLIFDRLIFNSEYFISLAFVSIYILLRVVKDVFMHEDINDFMSRLKNNM